MRERVLVGTVRAVVITPRRNEPTSVPERNEREEIPANRSNAPQRKRHQHRRVFVVQDAAEEAAAEPAAEGAAEAAHRRGNR